MKKNKLIIIASIFNTILVFFSYVFFAHAFFPVIPKSPDYVKVNYVEVTGFMEEFEYGGSERNVVTSHVFARGCVRDKESAAEIATVVFESIYRRNFRLPLIVSFDDTKQEWLVKAYFPKDRNRAGGFEYLIIKKRNSEIIAKVKSDDSTVAKRIFKNGYVPHEQRAAEIAAVIFKSVYGENFYIPLIVGFDDVKQEFLVKTHFPSDEDIAGGSKYLIIKKSNAEVVAIWATS